MRKVLQLRSTGAFLGAEKVVIELARNSKKFGYESIVGIPVDDDSEPELAKQARNYGLRSVLFPFSSPFSLASVRQIGDFVLNEGVDVIHSHGYREDIYAWLAAKPEKILATNHLWKRTSFRLRVYAALDAIVMRRFGGVTAVSQPIYDEMRGMGFSPKKLHLIENGICTEDYFPDKPQRLQARAELSLNEGEFVFCMVGSLSREKGHLIALSALADIASHHPYCKLVIVGDGEEAENLRTFISSHNLQDRLVFTGRRSDIPYLLQAVDCFLMPSLKEGLPMALLEAMATQLPVIASNVGDIPKVLAGNVGILIEPGSAGELATAMNSVLQDTEIEAMAARARAVVEARFSAIEMARKYAGMYESLTSGSA